MEHINWWQRRDRAPIVLIGLLLLGMALSFWAGCSGGLARERSRQLDQLRERVRADFAVLDQSLRGLLLDSRFRSELDAHGRAAEDLDRALEELENLSAGLPELLRVARGLRDFARNEHGRLHTQALERGESDRAKALEFYLQTAAAVGTTRDRHLQALERQIQTAQFALGRQADRDRALGGAAALLAAAAAGMVLRRQAAAVKRAAAALVEALGRLRAGDFGARSEAVLDGDFAVVAAALDRLAEEWDGLLREVRQAGATVQTAAGEAVTAARQQEGLAAEASRAATEIGSACGELAGKLTGCAAALGDVGALAGGAARRAAERQTELGQLETTLGTLHESAGRTGARLAALNEHLAGINSVIATVTKVADQTNLLSLNAAIEAEKAGEYGLGFAVVAMEMRRLADQTAVAAGELEKMLKELQAAVSMAVLSVEKLTEELRRGGEAVRHAGGQWSGLVQQVEEVPRRCQAVAEDAQAQTAAARRLGDQSAQLCRTADRVLELLHRSQAALGRLSEGVQQLQDRLARKSSSPQ